MALLVALWTDVVGLWRAPERQPPITRPFSPRIIISNYYPSAGRNEHFNHELLGP